MEQFFYNIKSQLAFLCIEVGMTIIYTLLVAGRLFRYRRQIESFVSREHLRTYDEVMTMVVESAAPSSILSIIFIISFAVHSYICNLVFLAVNHIQVSFKLLPEPRLAQTLASYLGDCATFHHHPCCSGTRCKFPDIFQWDPPRNHCYYCGKTRRQHLISGVTWVWNHCDYCNTVESK